MYYVECDISTRKNVLFIKHTLDLYYIQVALNISIGWKDESGNKIRVKTTLNFYELTDPNQILNKCKQI